MVSASDTTFSCLNSWTYVHSSVALHCYAVAAQQYDMSNFSRENSEWRVCVRVAWVKKLVHVTTEFLNEIQ